MNMGNWKSRIFKKQSKFHMGQTNGKDKVASCQADYKKKYMALRSRSYKDNEYSAWCKSMDALNNMKRV